MRLFTGEALDHKKIDELYQQSAWGKIIQSFAKTDLQQVDDIRVLNDLAVAYHQERQFDKALAVCERIKAVEMWTDLVKQQAELTPRYMRYHVVMGEALYRMGELEKALEIFTKLKVIGSRFSDKYYYSARIHTKKGNYRQALLEYKGMITNTPQRMRDVIRGVSELIDASPAQSGAYEQLYAASQHKDRVGHYTKKFQEEMKESKGALAAGLRVANMLFLQGDPAGARKSLASLKAASDEEKSWLALIEGDWTLAEKGPQEALEKYLSTESGLPPGSPLLIERLEDLVRTHKMGAHVRKKIAKLYEAGGDADGAARHLEAVVSETGDEAVKADLARILKSAMTAAFGANDLQRAQSMGTRYLKFFPDDQVVAGQIQQINQVLFVKRKEELEKYLAMGSRLPASQAAKFHYEMAGIEKAMMGSEEAIISHLQGAASERSPVRAQALRELGQIHLRGGSSDMAEAVHDILFGLKMGEDDRLAWAYELGEGYADKGEKTLAIKYFEMVTERDGTFRDAASRAGELKREIEAAAQAAPAAAAP
ncbi:MAG: hypothetical protein O2807_14170, partial [bacterium]|nr:hypothetical protein [bacterium]